MRGLGIPNTGWQALSCGQATGAIREDERRTTPGFLREHISVCSGLSKVVLGVQTIAEIDRRCVARGSSGE